MTRLIQASEEARPSMVRLPAPSHLLSETEYHRLARCEVEIAAIGVTLAQPDITAESKLRLIATHVRRALGGEVTI